MLKFFYKVCLVSILSGSLMLIDFSYKGALLQSAQAETVKTEAIKDKDLMGTLTMTAVGTIASRLYTYKMTTDVMLAAAGGAAFIAGEVLAYLKLKEVMKGMEQEITRDKNGNINQEQIAALERLKKSYEEAKKTANTKKMLQMAAAAAFAAAGVAAYTMAAGDMTALTTCTSGIGTALSTVSGAVTAQCQAWLSAPCPGPCTQPLGAQCMSEVGTCTAAITKYQQSLMTYEMARQASGPSAQGLATTTAQGKALQAELSALTGSCPMHTQAANGSLQGACQPLIPNNDIGTSGGAGLMTANNSVQDLPPILKKYYMQNKMDAREMASVIEKNKAHFSAYFEKAFNVIFPPAHAELFSAMGIASSAAVTFLLATSATLGPSIDMFLLIPQKRAIAWGVLAGLTFAATSATDNVISQIDANIKKIDTILQSMRSLTLGANTTQIAAKQPMIQTTIKPNSNLAIAGANYEEVDLSQSANGVALPCYTGGDSKNCKSFDESVKNLPSYNGLNADSQMQLSTLLKNANGFNGTSKITKGSLEGASNLAGQANALRSALDKAQKNAADRLLKQKSKINLAQQAKALSDSIEKGVNDSLKKSNSTAGQMYASMYGGRGGASAVGSSTASTDDKKVEELKKTPAAGTGVIDMSGAGASGEKVDLGLTGVTDNSKTMTPEELAAFNEAQKNAGATMDDYDLKENQISKDSSTSIFELISNRYQRTGYQRLFEKVKTQDPTKAKE
nr:hypothetical protein BHI3_06240 [Bacteriovorax sp. HI3]